MQHILTTSTQPQKNTHTEGGEDCARTLPNKDFTPVSTLKGLADSASFERTLSAHGWREMVNRAYQRHFDGCLCVGGDQVRVGQGDGTVLCGDKVRSGLTGSKEDKRQKAQEEKATMSREKG